MVEHDCNVAPLLGPILPNEPDQLLVLLLAPVTLLDGGLLVLVELVEALGVVAARDKSSNLYPIILVQFCG